jgi:hypothetical protein
VAALASIFVGSFVANLVGVRNYLRPS